MNTRKIETPSGQQVWFGVALSNIPAHGFGDVRCVASTWQAYAEAGEIKKGQRVIAEKMSGNTLFVRPVCSP